MSDKSLMGQPIPLSAAGSSPAVGVSDHTPGPWEYVPSTEHHGPYVVPVDGYGDICDCYTMSNLAEPSVRNGGTSKPIPFQHEHADANARLIAAAPDLLAACKAALGAFERNDAIDWGDLERAIAQATGAPRSGREADPSRSTEDTTNNAAAPTPDVPASLRTEERV